VYSAIFLGAVPLHLWLAAEVWERAFARGTRSRADAPS